MSFEMTLDAFEIVERVARLLLGDFQFVDEHLPQEVDPGDTVRKDEEAPAAGGR